MFPNDVTCSEPAQINNGGQDQTIFSKHTRYCNICTCFLSGFQGKPEVYGVISVKSCRSHPDYSSHMGYSKYQRQTGGEKENEAT
jgi:hypothetical protein